MQGLPGLRWLAAANPLRWTCGPFEQVVHQLTDEADSNFKSNGGSVRPVRMKLANADGREHQEDPEVHEFKTVLQAIEWLQKKIHESSRRFADHYYPHD